MLVVINQTIRRDISETRSLHTILGNKIYIFRYEHEQNKQTPWLLVRQQTIPTERPPLVGEVSANFSG
jgi:hypothetical protein